MKAEAQRILGEFSAIDQRRDRFNFIYETMRTQRNAKGQRGDIGVLILVRCIDKNNVRNLHKCSYLFEKKILASSELNFSSSGVSLLC